VPDDDRDEIDPLDGGAPRSLWSGSITFGLLSLAVDLFPAVRAETVPLKVVDQDHRMLTRRFYCPHHERFLSRDELVRGYDVGDEEYVLVTDDELEALSPEKSRAIDLRTFVDVSEIDPMYFQRSYLLTPAENEANRAYRLLAETMERSGRAGIATFVMRGKEYLVALLAENGLLRAETLRFRDELRTPQDVGLPLGIEADPSAVDRYRRAIAELAADGIDRAELVDTRVERLRALIDSKLARGVDVEKAAIAEESAEEAEIIDLMEVLKRRLQPEQRERAPVRPSEGERRGDDEAVAARDDLAERSKSELYERARALGVPGRSKMDKEELVRALRDAAE
jgi:DNA end-binding protein Ku